MHFFKDFFQNGLSEKESVILKSINLCIQDYLANFSGIVAKSEDGFKMYSVRDKLTGKYTFSLFSFINLIRPYCLPRSGETYFSSTRFSKPANHLMEYQKHFSKTQILACFYEKRKNRYYENFVEKNRRYGVLIANWVYFHWTLYMQRKKAAADPNFASSCFITVRVKKGLVKERLD